MLTINTNLSSLIAQTSMKTSTNRLNQAIERMTTGFKINHAKDNAANYQIASQMTTQINSLQVAEENTAMGLDMVTQASEILDELNNRVQRLRDLQEQANNGTYGEQSLKAINVECNALVDEINRIYESAEYNGITLFMAPTTLADGRVVVAKESDAELDTTFKDLGITATHFEIFDSDDNLVQAYDLEEGDTVNDFLTTLQGHGFTTKLKDGEITISSNTGLYVAGDLADELGISTKLQNYVASTEQSYSVNVETTSAQVSSTTVQTTTTTQTTQTNTAWITTTTETTQTNTVWTTTTTETTQTETIATTASSTISANSVFYSTIVVKDTNSMTSFASVDSTSLTYGTYSISTTAELIKLAEMTNNGFIGKGAEFILANNIDMSGITTWTPIGTESNRFNGVFDGNGYAIQNLNATINASSTSCVGFFGVVGNAGFSGSIATGYRERNEIFNLGLENVNFVVTNEDNPEVYIGGLAGMVYGDEYVGGGMIAEALGDYLRTSITNCYFKGSIIYESNVTDSENPDVVYLAGLVAGEIEGDSGEYGGYISNCYVVADLSATALDYATLYGIAQTGSIYSSSYSGTLGGGNGEEIYAISDDSYIYNSYAHINVSDDDTYHELDTSEPNFSNTYIKGPNGIESTDDWNNIEFTYSKQAPVIQSYEYNTIFSTTTTTTSTTETETIFTTTTSSTTQTTTLYVTTTSSTTQTNTVWITSTVAATGGTTFEELGVDSAFKVTVVSDGTKSALTINKTTSFDEFFAQLESKGFGVSEAGGKVELNGAGDTYLQSTFLNNLLSMSALSKTEAQKTVNTDSEHLVYNEILEDVYAPGTINLMVGTTAEPESSIRVDVSFKLTDLRSFRNIGVDGNDYLEKLDNLLTEISARQVQFGAVQNRLESVMDEISIKYDNLVSSRSTIRDADIAEVSSTYIQQQILQQASATLLATANQSPAIALQLI